MANIITVLLKKNPRVVVNQSNLVSNTLENLTDIDLSAKTDGAVLVYDEETGAFKATILLDKQIIDCGTY